MNNFLDENTIDDIIDELEYVYKSDDRPWIIGYSGGKDSTVVLHLVYTMLSRLGIDKQHKHVYVVSSDTMVENPLIKQYLHSMIKQLQEVVSENGFNMSANLVKPKPDTTFWANVIGRGFPTPRYNGTFRWCTDRLKIKPTGLFIDNIVQSKNTEVVILLGVRKGESVARKKRIEKRRELGKLLNRHDTTKGAYVYSPIADLTTNDVWDVLTFNNMKTAWGSDNKRIFELYSDADSGECPFAGINEVGSVQTQSCGNSRFGCWICTVVKEDKSLNGFIRSGHRELIPLQEFRRWLMEIRDISEKREKKMRDGRVYTDKEGNKGNGPFTWEARQEILTKLLKLQKQMNYELISDEELKAIEKIWDDELDLSRRTLVDIYEDVFGEKLSWDNFKKPLFDEDVLLDIEEIAKENKVEFELIRKLILETEKNKYFSNPNILKKSLESALNQQWIHYDYLKEQGYED